MTRKFPPVWIGELLSRRDLNVSARADGLVCLRAEINGGVWIWMDVPTARTLADRLLAHAAMVDFDFSDPGAS